jgi:mono/diheme cytochrome c family protein/chitodextrinase
MDQEGVMNNNLTKLPSLGVFVLALFSSQAVFGFSGGVSGYSGQGANTCVLCHSGGTTPTVNLDGPITVQPGTINTYTLTISGGQQNSGGLDVSVDAGTLISTVASTRLQSGEITHSARATADANGDVSFSFNWQAPSTTGPANIYSAGLSTNGDGGTGGDAVATLVSTITVSAGAAQLPTAVISAPQTAQVDTVVDFDGSNSLDPDSTIVSYEWDFGDGNTATGALTNNIYTAAGTYTVTLTVTDDQNLSDTTFRDITIGGLMIPNADAGGPYQGTEGQPVNVDGSGSTHVEPITNYIWDWGDGTPMEAFAVPTASHTYAQPGAYTVTLAVQDASNITGVASTTVVIAAVEPPPPPPSLDGPTLYANNCASCHGPLESSAKLNRSASQIQNAIDQNFGGMGALSGLTTEQVQAIADALVSTAPPPPPPTDGPTLYANNCAGCHGPLESSAKQNRTAAQIQGAIDAGIGGMDALSSLTADQVQAIADALVTATPPPPPPTDGPTLYANNCATCHGPLESSTKLNRTASQIQNAIDQNFGGMGALSGLSATDVQAIADALVSTAPPPPPPADGQTLYANNCAGCHGPLETSSKLNRTATQIQAAIDSGIGGMNALSSLTSDQVQAIADALVSTTPPPAPTTGEGLYNSYCLVCHGEGGTGGQYEGVTGASANEIASYIASEPLMNSLSSLNSTQLQAISDYLNGVGEPPPPPATGEQLYSTYCQACHGVNGTGGVYEGVTGSSASEIANYIQNEPLMQSISLNSEQIQAISDFLNGEGGTGGGTPPPDPTDGATLYSNNCAGCHGSLATSSKLDRTAAQIQAAIDANTGGMGGLSNLTATNIQAIADALSTTGGGGGGGTPPPPPDGATLYGNNCAGCHGPLASSTKTGRSAAQIQAAIDANTGGMGGLSSLTAAEVQAISDALGGGGTPPPPTTDGAALYTNNCAGCHGALESSAKAGRTAAQIQAAIDANTGGMGGLSGLSATEVQAIADALAGVGGGTPTTGEGLYISYCQSCHGFNGTGGSGGAIVGASAGSISSALSSETEMQGITLDNAAIESIANFLSSGGGSTPEPTTGAELYAIKCAACHGADGSGGTSGERVIGASTYEILRAMQSVSVMQPIPLTESQARAIANYLNGGDGGMYSGDGSGYGGWGDGGGHDGGDDLMAVQN